MDKETLNRFRVALQKEEEKLEITIKDLEKPVDFGSDVDHFDEEADEAEELSNRLGPKTTLQERLLQIKEALQRIRDGKYGACQKCGGEIEREVLEESPESALCKNCKNKEH